MVNAAQDVLEAEQEIGLHHFKGTGLAGNREGYIAWSKAVGLADAVGKVEANQNVRPC